MRRGPFSELVFSGWGPGGTYFHILNLAMPSRFIFSYLPSSVLALGISHKVKYDTSGVSFGGASHYVHIFHAPGAKPCHYAAELCSLSLSQ